MNDIVRVVHSESKTAWNIIGTIAGSKYKWARVPYLNDDGFSEDFNTKQKAKALHLAEFIASQINRHYAELNI